MSPGVNEDVETRVGPGKIGAVKLAGEDRTGHGRGQAAALRAVADEDELHSGSAASGASFINSFSGAESAHEPDDELALAVVGGSGPRGNQVFVGVLGAELLDIDPAAPPVHAGDAVGPQVGGGRRRRCQCPLARQSAVAAKWRHAERDAKPAR